MKRIKVFFVLLSLLVSTLAFGQNITVSGIVKDSTTDEPIPFASLQLKGTMVGSNTDANGVYSISVPQDAVLIVSSIGYKTIEVKVAGKAKHNVALLPDSEKLKETIVVAFGTSTKESFTGSAAVIKDSDISKVQSSDATRAIEGVVPGVQMTTSTGSLGSSPKIRIRGISSISAGNAPLYVVDGIPYSGDMNNLNANDIESMTVLKDAASNSLYGARGANGVIMITTKKARVGEAKINVDAKWGLNTKALKSYDFITEPGEYYEVYYAGLRNYYMWEGEMSPLEAHRKAAGVLTDSPKVGGLGYNVYTLPEGQTLIGSNGKLNPNATLGRKFTHDGQEYLLTPDNWLDEIYKKSLRQEYNVNVSGVTGKASIYASFGYLKNKAIVDNSDMYRYTARLKADYQAKRWLNIGANASYTKFNWNNGNSGEGDGGNTGNIFGAAQNMAPIYPLYIRDGQGNIMYDKYGYKRYDAGQLSPENYVDGYPDCIRPNMPGANPIQANQININNSEGNAFSGTGYMKIDILKNLKFTMNFGIGLDETRSTNMNNPYYGQFASQGGNVVKKHSRQYYINFQQLLNYNKTIARVHHIQALLGHENYERTTVGLGASKKKMFSIENLELGGSVIDGQSAFSSKGEYNTEGYFARVQYDYDNKIFTSVSYRRDASSKFHPDHRWGDFWSVGAGWLINRESWFNYSWVDMLKLKASIGSQGNDGIPSLLYTDLYSLSNNNGEIAISFSSKGNEKITWETNTNFNIGFDYTLFDSRVSGGFEYFSRKTSDMLFFFTVPQSLGYSGYYDNIGDMKNSGIEFSINATVMRNKNFNWDINFNATHYKNEVSMLPDERKVVEMEGYKGFANGNKFIAEGLPLNTFKLPKYAGVNPENGKSLWYKNAYETDADGNPVLGSNGKPVVSGRETTDNYSEATDYLCDDPTPKVYGGFGTSLDFYGFDFSVQCTYSLGGKTYDGGYAGLMASPSTGGSNIHKDIYKAWTPENKNSNVPRFAYNDQNTAAASDRFLVDASYLNIQNAQFGYTFPKKITDKIQLGSLRIYLACDNIFYVSKRKGLDPRFSFSGSTNKYVNSPVRTLSGGIHLSF